MLFPIGNSAGLGHIRGMSTTDFEISFVIPELTGAFDPRVSQVEEALDIVVSSHSGLAVATVIVAGSDAVAAGRAASATLSSCSLPPLRTYPDLVNRQDIADRLDVSRQAVGNWVRGERHQSHSFPTPVNMVAGGVWLWGDIAEWLRLAGRDPDDVGYPTLQDHARLDEFLTAAPEAVAVSRTGRIGQLRSGGRVSARVGFSSLAPGASASSVDGDYLVLCRESA